jgi:hypothetical protein
VRYYLRRWAESRGDEFDDWGGANYYFETDDLGAVLRQAEVYLAGQILRYDATLVEDTYGGLSEKPLDLIEFEAYASSKEAFDEVWPPGAPPGPDGNLRGR